MTTHNLIKNHKLYKEIKSFMLNKGEKTSLEELERGLELYKFICCLFKKEEFTYDFGNLVPIYNEIVKDLCNGSKNKLEHYRKIISKKIHHPSIICNDQCLSIWIELLVNFLKQDDDSSE